MRGFCCPHTCLLPPVGHPSYPPGLPAKSPRPLAIPLGLMGTHDDDSGRALQIMLAAAAKMGSGCSCHRLRPTREAQRQFGRREDSSYSSPKLHRRLLVGPLWAAVAVQAPCSSLPTACRGATWRNLRTGLGDGKEHVPLPLSCRPRKAMPCPASRPKRRQGAIIIACEAPFYHIFLSTLPPPPPGSHCARTGCPDALFSARGWNNPLAEEL
ncbi:hypothetical protein BJ166DRAFT_162551 [Pestalotiopsis sp. NC0098]|nr:hypothetical protein BJ166DRAFT_162551 [Pestalotiopsis sp. NC0098]